MLEHERILLKSQYGNQSWMAKRHSKSWQNSFRVDRLKHSSLGISHIFTFSSSPTTSYGEINFSCTLSYFGSHSSQPLFLEECVRSFSPRSSQLPSLHSAVGDKVGCCSCLQTLRSFRRQSSCGRKWFGVGLKEILEEGVPVVGAFLEKLFVLCSGEGVSRTYKLVTMLPWDVLTLVRYLIILSVFEISFISIWLAHSLSNVAISSVPGLLLYVNLSIMYIYFVGILSVILSSVCALPTSLIPRVPDSSVFQSKTLHILPLGGKTKILVRNSRGQELIVNSIDNIWFCLI